MILLGHKRMKKGMEMGEKEATEKKDDKGREEERILEEEETRNADKRRQNK